MKTKTGTLIFAWGARAAAACYALLTLAAPTLGLAQNNLELPVQPGVPLHIRIEGRPAIRTGQALQGRLLQPVWVHDRQVLPAGTLVQGRISGLKPVPWPRRVQTYMHGRLRLEREPIVVFERLVDPEGRYLSLHAPALPGIPNLMRLAAGQETGKRRPGGRVQAAKERAKAAVTQNEAVIAARSGSGGAKEALRAAGRMARSQLLAYWPFGTRRVSAGTAFTAVLSEPLHIPLRGEPAAEKLAAVRLPLPPDAVVHARLLETLSSESAAIGTRVRAVITRPLKTPDGKLILPEGAHLTGEVAQARPARRFGRNGRLQVRFTELREAPQAEEVRVAGTVEAVHADAGSGVRLDEEGGASIPFAKKRLIAPLAASVAAGTAPEGESTVTAHGAAPGWSGFGLAGTAVALAVPAAAGPIGWWGAGSSIYFRLLRKADEVVFPAHTMIEIRLGRTATAERSE